MQLKQILLIILISIFVASFGCIEGEKNETKLDVEEGVGVVGLLKIDELRPGLEGYVSLTLRSNLEGKGATDVVIALDNVKPFEIVECGGRQNPEGVRGCRGQLDLDKGLKYRMRKTKMLFPGQELDVFWRLAAPSKAEISDIALKHPLYYNIEYTYKVGFHQSIVFMSQDELVRRKQAGEEYIIEGESGSTAGELRFSGVTQQPIIFFFDNPPGYSESDFSFALQFFVENKGKGFPISDVVILLEFPEGIEYEGGYGWKKWEGFDDNCKISILEGKEDECKTWINKSFGKEFETINTSRLIAKKIKRENFVGSFSIYAPMIMLGKERERLKDNNIPIKIYTFKVYALYRYFIEGKEYINVVPIRV